MTREDLLRRSAELNRLADSVTVDNIEAAIRGGMTQLGALRGDPARITDLAGAYRAAAQELRVTAAELLAEFGETMLWKGKAADDAAEVVLAETRELSHDGETMAAAADALTAHAELFAANRRRHEELHQWFTVLHHKVSLVLPLLSLDAGLALTHTGLVAAALTDAAGLLTEVRTDADAIAETLRRLQDGVPSPPPVPQTTSPR